MGKMLFLAAGWLVVASTTLGAQQPQADPLAAIDTVASLTATNEQRAAAFRIVRAARFAAVGHKILSVMEHCDRRRGRLFVPYTPPASEILDPSQRVKEVWLDESVDVEQRVLVALCQLWFEHGEGVGPEEFPMLVAALEDASLGRSRGCAMTRLWYVLMQDSPEVVAMLPAMLTRIEKVASTDTSPAIRAESCALLVEKVERPETCIELAFAISGTSPDGPTQCHLLLRTGIVPALPRMPVDARRRLLALAFGLLRRVDDDAGTGSGLAGELGRALGIRPVSRTAWPFSPDPQARGGHGPGAAFERLWVANALAWYELHKND